ncbi:MAG: hypothetical protein GXO29_05865 [Thermotogae bacterium]|nr:hypothetical protein [Thermotogota bacterium]
MNRWRRIVGIVLLVVFFIYLFLLYVNVYMATLSSPLVATFLLSFIGFYLFANRLVFGYWGIISAAGYYSRSSKIDRERVARATNYPLQLLQNLTAAAVLSFWLSYLEPFKYALYLVFFLLFLFNALIKVNIITNVAFGPFVDAAFWGAFIPTFVVLILELLARWRLSKLLT